MLTSPGWKSGFARNRHESQYPNLWDGLIGAWLTSLGPTGDRLADISPYKNAGARQGGGPTVWSLGANGWQQTYDGTDDYILAENATPYPIDSHGTISCFVTASSATPSGSIVEINDGSTNNRVLIYFGSTDTFRVFIDSSTSAGLDVFRTTTSFHNPNQLYHIVFQWDTVADVYRMWVDGVEALNQLFLITSDAPAGMDAVTIGARFDGTFLNDEDIGNVQIYNRFLEPSERELLFRYPDALVTKRAIRIFIPQVAPAATTVVAVQRPSHVKPSYKMGHARTRGEAANPNLWDGLIGAWFPTLGTSDLNVRDISGFGNHGTFSGTGSRPWELDREWSINFDAGASNDLADFGSPDLLTEIQVPLTLCARVIFDTVSGTHTVFAHFGSATNHHRVKALRVESSGAMTYHLSTAAGGTQNFASNTTIATNRWYNLAVTVSGTLSVPSVTFYQDGVADGTASPAALSATPNGTEPVRFGSRSNSDTDLLNGRIQYVTLHNRVLTPNEIRQIHRDQHALVRRKTPMVIAIPAAVVAVTDHLPLLGVG